jgi:hypothetical protein
MQLRRIHKPSFSWVDAFAGGVGRACLDGGKAWLTLARHHRWDSHSDWWLCTSPRGWSCPACVDAACYAAAQGSLPPARTATARSARSPRWWYTPLRSSTRSALAVALEMGADFHYVVHQASGMVAAQLDVSVGQALIRLKAYAFGNGRPLAEVAEDVVARKLRFAADGGKTDP